MNCTENLTMDALDNNNIIPVEIPKKKTGVTRVWCDGCYDLVHFGHANSLRQAKLLGHELIVGVHSDAAIAQHKGPPVFNEQERYAMVRAIKWVDHVVENAPYVTTVETLDRYDCDFSAHGDDITTTADGSDTYQEVKDAQRYKEYERTQGVSTTELVSRMLRITNNHCRGGGDKFAVDSKVDSKNNMNSQSNSPWTGTSQFLPTTRKLQLFSEGREPKVTDTIVYVAGAFDVLHPGHLGFLEEASKLGDFLIVGLHTDRTVNMYKGNNFPIMNLHERVLSVLACKYVSEVVIGAPYVITKDLLDHFNVGVVAHGSRTPIACDPESLQDPYYEAKLRNIFIEIDSKSDLTTQEVVKRIMANREVYEERNAKKEKKEILIYEAMQRKEAEDKLNNNKIEMIEVES